jgi:hypothetical protein
LRSDFGLFLHRCFLTLNPGAKFHTNFHIDAVSYRPTEVTAGKCTRQIFNFPPRYLKSTIVSVAYVAWVLGHDPTKRIFVVSYADELSFKHAP